LFASWGLYNDWPRMCTIIPQSMDSFRASLVALAWMQSYVRDPAQRELLYELDLAREHLLASAPEAPTTGLVDKSYANLLRMWGDV
ncbi:MAG: hypothetical protein KZQ65_02095, partial [Candidatus Thiodiazotropha sp. (ex Gloverina cf. vestifex)]|nr:hypothetical protein [Candidatus Thiodiazotropha sp. (ex Gloverina cf. vestifex)]